VTERAALAERVAQLEADALAQLDSVLGGRAMCRVDGGSRRPAKHWEGRAAALAEVRRSLRRASPAEHSEVLARTLARWTGQLSGLGGEAWQHYTRGGLSALEELEHR
jgi:hypothetical protein